MIITSSSGVVGGSSFGAPSNYVGTKKPDKFSKRLGILLRRPLPPVLIYPKEFKKRKGEARYFPAPEI